MIFTGSVNIIMTRAVYSHTTLNAIQYYINNCTFTLQVKCTCTCSGVATGWHGWTMSRGPGAKGAPKRKIGKKNKRKKKRLSKSVLGVGQRNKVIQYWGGAPESLLSMGPERPRYATVHVT